MWTATLRCFVTWIVCSGAGGPFGGRRPARTVPRRGRRVGVRGAGRPPRADGPGRLPADPVDPHDADDAFQATFLVLARKAARLRAADRLGPWLYGVATRVAKKARTRAARHRHEALTECPARERREAEWSDVMPILDAELGRLPSRHRDVLVLCLLEGASAEEAAQPARLPGRDGEEPPGPRPAVPSRPADRPGDRPVPRPGRPVGERGSHGPTLPAPDPRDPGRDRLVGDRARRHPP